MIAALKSASIQDQKMSLGGTSANEPTVSIAVRVVLPCPFVVFVKLIVVGPYVPGARPFALAFTVKVTVVADVVAVPEVAEAVSQLGTPEIEKFTDPLVALS